MGRLPSCATEEEEYEEAEEEMPPAPRVWPGQRRLKPRAPSGRRPGLGVSSGAAFRKTRKAVLNSLGTS